MYCLGWTRRYPAWRAAIVPVERCLISNKEMRELGTILRDPHEFPHDPLMRVQSFIDSFDHRYVIGLGDGLKRRKVLERETLLP